MSREIAFCLLSLYQRLLIEGTTAAINALSSVSFHLPFRHAKYERKTATAILLQE